MTVADLQTCWAYDSNNCELDPGLKAAHRVAVKDSLDKKGLPDPILLRNLLSDEQIDAILMEASVEGVWPRGVKNTVKKASASTVPPCHRHRFFRCIDNERNDLSDELRQVPHHLAWTSEHVVLYMHMNDHWFVRELPVPWSLIRGGMESRPWMEGAVPVLADEFIGSEQSKMQVRTIELHHYSAGGGLLIPGHRDCGSDLTISVLLSDSAEVSGGDFVTYHEGVPIAHKMERGDAILFESEKLHNISTVTSGVRKSLVVELWPSKRY